MRISWSRRSTPSSKGAAPVRKVKSATAKSSSCHWTTASASAPASAARRRFSQRRKDATKDTKRLCLESSGEWDELTIPRSIVSKHGVEGNEQFSHTGGEDDLESFSGPFESLSESLEGG